MLQFRFRVTEFLRLSYDCGEKTFRAHTVGGYLGQSITNKNTNNAIERGTRVISEHGCGSGLLFMKHIHIMCDFYDLLQASTRF